MAGPPPPLSSIVGLHNIAPNVVLHNIKIFPHAVCVSAGVMAMAFVVAFRVERKGIVSVLVWR